MGAIIAAAAGILAGVVLCWIVSRLAGSGRKAELLAMENQRLRQESLQQQENFNREFSRKESEFEEKLRLTETLWSERLGNQVRSARTEKENAEKARLALQEELEYRAAEAEKHQQAKWELLKSEFKNLSEKLLEEKSGKLQHTNSEQLTALLSPLKEQLTEFRKAVDDSKSKGIELHARLAAELKKMMEETSRIGGEARTLVNALRGQQKTQGDWGELILEEILRSSGLRPGIHYEVQTTIRDASGVALASDDNRKMRPDIIVHYPDDRDVIIDSKVSLKAYTDYAASEDPAGRQEALNRHIQSIKNHVTELAKKNYAAYWQAAGRETVDFVIMFIAPEGAYHLAMIESPTLWNEAFQQKVLIVSPANLMALLKIIHIAWEREEQNRNQQEILDTASQMLERIYAFYKDFDAIGYAMGKMHDAYTSATHRLKSGDGNHSVVNSGEKLKQLGIRTKKEAGLPLRLQYAEPPENNR